MSWLTLGDVRLAALRLAAAGGLPALAMGLSGATPSGGPWLAFAAWAVVPPALAERYALRRDAAAPSVGLAAGLAAAVSVPVALLQGMCLKSAHALGPVAALEEVASVPLIPLGLLSLAAYAAFAGATYVIALFEVQRKFPGQGLSVEEVILPLFAFSVGLPVLVCYGLSGLLGRLVPGETSTTPER